MRNNSRTSRPADLQIRAARASRRAGMRLARTALVVTGVWLTPTGQQLLRAQTYVQVAELDPSNPIGPRITSTVTQAKLSGRTLFGSVGDKVTYIWYPDGQGGPIAYQFASDVAWNRVLLGQKDVYIHGFSGDTSTPLQGPAGMDYANQTVQWLPVFVADRANSRVVIASFVDS
jgi:hypothetical protein